MPPNARSSYPHPLFLSVVPVSAFLQDLASIHHRRTYLGGNVPRTINEEEIDLSLNDVLVRGRVSSTAVEKELPSGDKVCEFRIVISRATREGVDTLDIAVWKAALRRTAKAFDIDDWVEVTGSIRRRFWKTPSGLASRWQIEAIEITRL